LFRSFPCHTSSLLHRQGLASSELISAIMGMFKVKWLYILKKNQFR
jgi:hypothetical protein